MDGKTQTLKDISNGNNELYKKIDEAKKIYETGILYMKLDEFESAKMTFQTVIDMYYDTEIIQLAYQGMVEALARNKEIDEAKTLLSEHENVLVESGLYDDAAKTVEKMQKTIMKASN